MKIAIDLDDTLFMNNTVVDAVSDFNYSMTRFDIKSWDLLEIPEDCRHEIYKRWKDPTYMCNLIPCEYNEEVIKDWHNLGHELYCVTSRYKGIEVETKEMVFKHFPNINEVYVCEGSKINVLNDIKPDLFIDDGPHYITEAINLNIRTVMISNKYTPYNHFLRNSVEWSKNLKGVRL